ncbi:TPA: type II toxin-antitoxin system RelE/ParE family toxin [Legionella feeleii]|uniref:Toxin RelG n=1 Tax=Legionella feeleii TaxID=453 RepID=A0A0W0U299_9GAMM|nr:type II toxin-antitoxin system RelE/ParE family toxin [Legionella feeleii]KTD02032.1 Toxin RelG [Legionella feeleii]SPX59885.1 Toxin RelG [Legionella feeleii]
MSWTIKIGKKVEKQLSKLDKTIQTRILDFLAEIEKKDNPRVSGHSLKGELGEFWRYRVGDYRIICQIEDGEVTILVIKIAHRREAYKK